MKDFDLSLYLVTDRGLAGSQSLEEIVEKAVEGGVTLVQLREKDCSTEDFYSIACSMKRLLSKHKIPLIINDRLDIALACDADGIHIGQSDLPYDVVRKIIGKDKIVGLSVETIEQAREANDLDVDYIGLSPVFSTNTKTDINTPLGLEGIKEISSFTKHKSVAIGGISKLNTKDIIQSGADGISVISAIIGQEDPQKESKELIEIIKDARKELR